ncbi:MAG: hypothetical protein MI747_14845, partial [Desulfobacterales bacterium]|nr:hypothetical protein [Desulfobacterales bacterium]
AANCITPQLPHGLDAEIFSMASLKRAWENAELPSELEHVTPYIRKPENGFSTAETRYAPIHAHHRWCVDEPEDFTLVEKIYAALFPENPHFTTRDIIAFLETQPHLVRINGHIDSRAAGAARDQKNDQNFLNP